MYYKTPLNPTGKQKNPSTERNRKESKIKDVIFLPLGEYEKMFDVNRDKYNGKNTIYINTDHSFYTKFYCGLDKEEKRMVYRLILSMYFATATVSKCSRTDLNDEDKEILIDEYIGSISKEFRGLTNKTF